MPGVRGSEYNLGQVLCETHEIDEAHHNYQGASRPFASPRFVARKQLETLKLLGYDLKSVFEVEYILEKPGGKPLKYKGKMRTKYHGSPNRKVAYGLGQGQFEVNVPPLYGI